MGQRTSGLEAAPGKLVDLKHRAGNEASWAGNWRLWIGLVALGLAAAVQAQDRRVVTQPTTPALPYCQVLQASLPALSPVAFVPPRAFDDVTESHQFFVGYDATHPLNIQLDNVVLENQDPNLIVASDAIVTLGPGPANFTPTGPDVTVFDDITAPDEPPVDCSIRFVPFVAAGIPCDANGDGRIDHDDIAAIGAAVGYSAYPGDPRDVDGDRVVTGHDVAVCATRCRHAACAP